MLKIISTSILLFVSCGNLPRTTHKDQNAPTVTATALTGLVIQSTDSSYSSTVLFFYDLSAGKISLLAAGDKENGDTFVKWLNGRIYYFNRFKQTYTTLSPKSGISSRSSEHTNSDLAKFDPVAATAGPSGELILGMNSNHSLLFLDERDFSTTAKLGDANFRPADMWLKDSTVYVTHQALDQQYTATGAGKIYAASKESGNWAFKSTYDLTISNPIYAGVDADQKNIIAGVCYKETGTSCVPGVDRFDPISGQTTHLSSWDESKWYPNGGFYTDLTDDSLLTCVIEKSTNKNVIARYKVADGSMAKLFELSGPVCAGVIADRVGMKIFVGQTLGGTTGSISVLDANGTVQSTANMDAGISGLTASFD